MIDNLKVFQRTNTTIEAFKGTVYLKPMHDFRRRRAGPRAVQDHDGEEEGEVPRPSAL